MSTDFDFSTQPPPAAPGVPGAGTATLVPPAPAAPSPAAKASPAPASDPISGLWTYAITAAPPIAMIAGSYLAHLYGQWMAVGLAIAAVLVTAAGVKRAWRRVRDRKKGKGGARTARTNPSARAGGRLLGTRGSGATTGKSGGGLFGRGGKGAAGRKTAAQAARSGGSGSATGGARSARRNAQAAAARSAAGGAGGGRLRTRGRGVGAGTGRAGTGGLGAKSTAARTPASRTTPSAKSAGASAGRSGGAHAKPGLLRRGLGALAGRGSAAPGAAPKKAAAQKKATAKKRSSASKPVIKTLGKKAAAKIRARKAARAAGAKGGITPKKRPTPTPKKHPKKTSAKKTPTRKHPKKGSAPGSGKKKTTAKKRKPTSPSKRKPTSPVKKKPYGKGAKKMHRRLKRAATHRKVLAMKRGGRKLWRGTRRAGRASSALVSPLLARGALALGRRLGWAHRHMQRIANTAGGPAFLAPVARAMAWGLGRTLRTGQWVMRRRKVAAWMLRHYAATGGGHPVGVAASVVRKVSLKKATKVKPGAPVPIHVPVISTKTGVKTVGSTQFEEVADSFDNVAANYEPQSVEELTQHLDDFAPMFERFAESLLAMATRLQDSYGVKPGVIDMVLEFSSANAGMTDMCRAVIDAWRIEQAEDIDRHENPRPGETEFWNVQP